jgi:hypothetical protein
MNFKFVRELFNHSASTQSFAPGGGLQWRNKAGQLHRQDGPALISTDGTKEWYRQGQRHRADGPAVEYPSGGKDWYRNGLLHRDDGPASEQADGAKSWWLNGKLHREDGPAVEHADGGKAWYRNGQLLTTEQIAAIQERIEESKKERGPNPAIAVSRPLR